MTLTLSTLCIISISHLQLLKKGKKQTLSQQHQLIWCFTPYSVIRMDNQTTRLSKSQSKSFSPICWFSFLSHSLIDNTLSEFPSHNASLSVLSHSQLALLTETPTSSQPRYHHPPCSQLCESKHSGIYQAKLGRNMFHLVGQGHISLFAHIQTCSSIQ